MNNEKIVFSRLTDMTRLSEVHRLTHDSFVEGGLIDPVEDGLLDIYPHLDKIEETYILIAEQEGEIIASNSITLDNPNGLQSDKFFKLETDALRRKYNNLGSSWRIVTAQRFRRDIRLIKRLIDFTAIAAGNLGIEHCLYCFATKHEKIYERLIGANTIKRKLIYYQEGRQGNEFALMLSASADFEWLEESKKGGVLTKV